MRHVEAWMYLRHLSTNMFPQDGGKKKEKKKFRIGFRAETHDAQRLAQEKCVWLHRIFSPMSFPFPSSFYRMRRNLPFAHARNFPLITSATAPDVHGGYATWLVT